MEKAPSPMKGEGHGVRADGATPAQLPQEDCSTLNLNTYSLDAVRQVGANLL